MFQKKELNLRLTVSNPPPDGLKSHKLNINDGRDKGRHLFKSRIALLSTWPRRFRLVKRGQNYLEVSFGSYCFFCPIVSSECWLALISHILFIVREECCTLFNTIQKQFFSTSKRFMHQSIPAVPSPPRAIAGHFPALSIPGVGH